MTGSEQSVGVGEALTRVQAEERQLRDEALAREAEQTSRLAEVVVRAAQDGTTTSE